MKYESNIKEQALRTQIALGAVTVLLLVSWMLISMILESALADDGFRSLHLDPGPNGLSMIVYIVAFYALLPVFVYLPGAFRSRVFRWFVVVFAALGFLFWVLHHLSHLVFGQRPTFTSNVLDLTAHAVGLWMLINAIRWARFPAPVRETDPAFIENSAGLCTN